MLKETIENDIIIAMKEKPQPKERIETLKLIKAEIQRYEVDKRIPIDDKNTIKILNKMKDRFSEAAELYKKAGKVERFEQENFSMQVVKEYLPELKLATENDLKIIYDECLVEIEMTQQKANMGSVIRSMQEKLENHNLFIEGKDLANYVKAKFAK